ncbi:MAG TPA: hypothetical protein VGB45_11545 [Abditibacterium sp.]
MTLTKTISSPLMHRVKPKPKKESEATIPPPISCLQQAEICREQARDAARLKRFSAAFGLFMTATGLCRHALSFQEIDEMTRSLACDQIMQIDLEMATYAELFKAKKQ